MTWILGLGAVGAFLAWFFLAPARPAIERNQPLSRVGESVSGISMSVPQSRLLITHEASGRFFTISKPSRDLGLQQTVELRVSSFDWPSAPLELLAERLLHSTLADTSESRDGVAERVLHFRLTGHPQHDLETAGRSLAQQLSVLLADGEEDQFTLQLDGRADTTVWRRINATVFRQVAAGAPSWLHRKFAQRQLRKIESDQSKQSTGGTKSAEESI